MKVAHTVVGLIASALAGFACRDAPRCGPRADHAVVACVDQTAITAAAAREHLRPPRPLPGRATPPTPAERAVDDAIRVQLFADEASRRGLAPRSARVAVRHRALVDHLAATSGRTPAEISDDEAAAAYAATPGRYGKVEAVRARAIYLAEPAAAEATYQAAVGADDAGFAALAQGRSRDPSAAAGGDLGAIDEHTATKELVRLASELRHPGDLLGPRLLDDGRYVILRATEVTVRPEPLAGALPRVKATLARAALEEQVAAEAARLALGRRVTIFADAVAHLATTAEAPP